MERNNTSSKVGLVIAGLVLTVGVIGALLFVVGRPSDSKVSSAASDGNKEVGADTPTGKVGATTIIFTDNGFDKAEYTAKSGEAITVRNDSSMDLQFSSDSHPTHRDHPELNEAVLSPGGSSTFTPAGKGTYGFHDHIHDQYTGVLIVQ